MAEVGRRTVIIRGQVVDRYSPRRSIAEVDYGERRPRDESAAPGYRTRPRRPSADDADRPLRLLADDAPRAQRSPGYESRRPPRSDRTRRRPYDAPRARPDRIAMWAVLLGVVLILAAATSSHAAVIAHAVAH